MEFIMRTGIEKAGKNIVVAFWVVSACLILGIYVGGTHAKEKHPFNPVHIEDTRAIEPELVPAHQSKKHKKHSHKHGHINHYQ
jgi:hypothetical protein